MEAIELIPMQEEQRQQLRLSYVRPFRRKVILSTTLLILCIFMIMALGNESGPSAISGGQLTGIFLLLILYSYNYRFQSRVKRYYYEDYKFGFIIKEYTSVTRVFDTPAGINIYWLSSSAIKTFTPDPYRHFREGDQVVIYYLKHANEYLAYEC